MAIEDAIWALQEHWTEVAGRLDDQARAELGRLLAELNGPDRPGALARIADLLVEVLPREDPVRRALIGGRMLAPAVLDWPSITRTLLDLSAASLDLSTAPQDQPGPPLNLSAPPGRVGGDPPRTGVLQEVTERLLGALALSEEQVRGLGLDPADPGLIQLARADGRYQWPAFQFGTGGGVPAVVRLVNELLAARTDPFGVADWWLSRNGWLGDLPSRLIGTIPDGHILAAARAVTAEV